MSYSHPTDRQLKAEAKRLYLSQREQEAAKLNQGFEAALKELESILETALQRKATVYKIVAQIFPPLTPPSQKAPSPPDRDSFRYRVPEASFLEKLTGMGGAKRRTIEDEIRKDYENAVKTYQVQKTNYEASIIAYQAAVAAQSQAIKEFHEQLQAKDPQAIKKYFTAVLENSIYPPDFPKPTVRLSFARETGELVLEYNLPKFEEIVPSIKGYKYVKARDEIEKISLTQTDERKMKALYEDVIASITLRTIHELFSADEISAINLVIFNGMVNTIDKATGKDIRPCLVSVQVTREQFVALDLKRVDRTTCLKHLKAQTSPSFRELVPIKPIVDLVITDPRFIQEVDVLSKLDSRPNLLDMTPGDFEQLIANLFNQIGFKTGTTRLSRDGGVDVIAFDDRPLLGGKIVIQAKRYRNVVEVESVRALYGVMQDEGATKGILVTTSSFGKASREFVQGKPIELMDGNNLLYHLERQGFQAKIELPK